MNSFTNGIPVSLGEDIKPGVFSAALKASGAWSDAIVHEGEVLHLLEVDSLKFKRKNVNGPPLLFGRVLYGKEKADTATYARHFRVYLAGESEEEVLSALDDRDAWLEQANNKNGIRVETGKPFVAVGGTCELTIQKRVSTSGPSFPKKAFARAYEEEGLIPVYEGKSVKKSAARPAETEEAERTINQNPSLPTTNILPNLEFFEAIKKTKFGALHPQDFPDAKLERSFPLIRCEVKQLDHRNATIDCYYGIPAVSGFPETKDPVALYKITHEMKGASSAFSQKALDEKWDTCGLAKYEMPYPLDRRINVTLAREPKLQVLENKIDRLDFIANPEVSTARLFWHADMEELFRQHYQLSRGVDLQFPLMAINHSGRSGAGICSLKACIKASEVAIYENAQNAAFQDMLRNGVMFIANVVMGDRQLGMAEHALACNRVLREAGLPFPACLKDLAPYSNTGQHYAIYQHAVGKHFFVDANHLVELGNALAVMHTRRNPLPDAPESNVMDAGSLLEDLRWAIEQTHRQEVDADEEKIILASSEEMQTSAIGQLLDKFGSFKALPPEHADLYRTLGLTEEKAEAFFTRRREEEKLFEGLPVVPICWNDLHLKNLLAGANGITMLDTQNTGKGMPAKELGLGLYFLCADDDGLLDYARVWSFMSPYIDTREKESNKTGTPPFCQEEFKAALNRMLILADPEREAHPIAMMFQQEDKALYENFNKRHYKMREQMQEAGYLDEKGRMTDAGAKAVFENATGRKWMDLPSCKDMAYRHKYGKYLAVNGKAPFEERKDNSRKPNSEGGYRGRLNAGVANAQCGAWSGRMNDSSNWDRGLR